MKNKREILSEIEQINVNKSELSLFENLVSVLLKIIDSKKLQFKRVLPIGEYILGRHVKAEILGFGSGTTIYDSAVVLGDVTVGKQTWIGPNVILDGSGGLTIGSNCSISAGAQIYSHDSIEWAVSGGKSRYEYSPTVIEDNCYIGPNSIIQKGTKIGKGSIIGANSLVNTDVPPDSKAFGSPIMIKSRNK